MEMLPWQEWKIIIFTVVFNLGFFFIGLLIGMVIEKYSERRKSENGFTL